uniref:Reverse transcriptase/retrotransposon-derived protein RNase H-like domain-containing protein n=1 Tax=Strix occidentalis caurina TaxID=311401 RepID=A0A8D0FBQ9_STROC
MDWYSHNGYLDWTDKSRTAFKQLKQALMEAPALGLPDLTQSFELFTYEKKGVSLGVLAQFLGTQPQTVAYFSKQLDNVSQGRPGCLKAVAATVLLMQEARKFTLGQKITWWCSHLLPPRLKGSAVLVSLHTHCGLSSLDDYTIKS